MAAAPAGSAGGTQAGSQTGAEQEQSTSEVAEDKVERIAKLVPFETTIVFSGLSANVISGPTDNAGHVFAFIACILITAVVRLPLVLMPSGRRQVGYYVLHLFICACWIYSLGGYLIEFGIRDDQFAWGLMLVLGVLLPLLPIGNPKSKPLA